MAMPKNIGDSTGIMLVVGMLIGMPLGEWLDGWPLMTVYGALSLVLILWTLPINAKDGGRKDEN
jgi:hypothetical protein